MERAPGKGKKRQFRQRQRRALSCQSGALTYSLQFVVVVLIIVSNECVGAMISALANNKERLCPRRRRNLLKYGWTLFVVIRCQNLLCFRHTRVDAIHIIGAAEENVLNTPAVRGGRVFFGPGRYCIECGMSNIMHDMSTLQNDRVRVGLVFRGYLIIPRKH